MNQDGYRVLHRPRLDGAVRAKISVLIPARNAALTLDESIASVLANRGLPYEVWVIDHGSHDQTSDQVLKWHRRDARMGVLWVDGDVPFAQALEWGRQHCSAPLVARMDADDRMGESRLASDMKCFENRSEIDVVACRTTLFPDSEVGEGMARYNRWQNEILDPQEHALAFWVEQPICHPAVTFRQRAVDAVGGYRAGPFPEDYDLFMRLHAAGSLFLKREETDHAWRQHRHQMTRLGDQYSRDAFASVKARALKERFGLFQRPVAILGAGKEGGRIGRALQKEGVCLAAYFDVAPHRIGSTRLGVPILADEAFPAWYQRFPEGFAIGAVGTRGVRPQVRARLLEVGFVEGVDSVVVA